MRTVRSVAELRALVGARRSGWGQSPPPVGLVPTMGSLHDGHLSLIRAARAECGCVVVSVFVNPAQFDSGEDLDIYPRNEARDAALAAEAGADVLFVPSVDEVYPPGFDTWVEVRGVSQVLEGDPAQRGADHFRGVTTVVTKLLNIVGPDVAYFGQKDAQQAVVIRKLVRDLDIPVRVAVHPTVRDDEGLALSSRNIHLEDVDRARALALSRALSAGQAAVRRGERATGAVLEAARSELERAGVEPEYLELRSADDLSPVERVNGSTLLLVAARVGRARLIDNAILGDT